MTKIERIQPELRLIIDFLSYEMHIYLVHQSDLSTLFFEYVQWVINLKEITSQNQVLPPI